METKLEQLTHLGNVVSDVINAEYKEEWKLADKQHSLWSGNPDSNIMIIFLCPDRGEVSWALRDNSFAGSVSRNPSGELFKRAAKRSGFNPDHDFFYCNLIPVRRIGDISPDWDMIQDFAWVFNSLLKIVEPKIIVTLGKPVLEGIVNTEIQPVKFLRYLNEGIVINVDNEFTIYPIQDPKIIEGDIFPKDNKHFFQIIRTLYIRTHELRK